MSRAAAPAIREATKRAIQNKLDEKLAKQGYYYDPDAAERPILFSRKFLRGSKGRAGNKPVEFIPAIQTIVRRLFGWMRPDGTRRFRTLFLGVPKKNTKSFTISALMLFLMCADREPGAHCFAGGVELSQSRVVWDEAAEMASASPALLRELKINNKGRVNLGIFHPRSKSFFKPMSSTKKAKEGLDAHAIAFDELHVWNRKLWSALKYATAARRQPLKLIITTAGDDCASFAKHLWDQFRDIQNGVIEAPDTLSVIYEPGPNDDLEDPRTWEKVNPGWNHSIEPEQFKLEFQLAHRDPQEWRDFQRYRLNVWLHGAVAWLRPEAWEKCGAVYTLDRFKGLRCFAGLDLSRTTDSTSLVLIAPPQAELTKYISWPKIWIPQGTAESDAEPVDWLTWAQNGFVEITPGTVTDYEGIVRHCKELTDRGLVIAALLYDPHFAHDIVQRVQNETGILPIAFAQSLPNFKRPCAEFKRLYESDQFEHPQNPAYSWQMQNTAVKGDVNNGIRPIKPPENNRNKIDSMIATLEALAGCLQEPSAGIVETNILQ